MILRSSDSQARSSKLVRALLLAGAVVALLTIPAEVGSGGHPGIAWQTALGKPGGGPGGGPGERGGPGHEGGRGHGKAHGPSGGHGGKAGPDTASYRDLGELMDKVRNGRAFGLDREDERVATARGRYRDALAPAGHKPGKARPGLDGRGPDLDRIAYGFAPAETRALIERGWKGPNSYRDGFRNHGHRTRTMVELARRLGYGAHVGALQANFGTRYENGIADLEAQLAEAEAAGNEAEVERLEAEIEAAVAAAKPGVGPQDSWASADLDVNDDGSVDQQDLDALDQQEAAETGSDEDLAS